MGLLALPLLRQPPTVDLPVEWTQTAVKRFQLKRASSYLPRHMLRDITHTFRPENRVQDCAVSTCHVLVSMARTNQKPEKLVWIE